LCLPDFEAIGT